MLNNQLQIIWRQRNKYKSQRRSESYKNFQVEIIELQNTVTDINSLNKINSRVEMTGLYQ